MVAQQEKLLNRDSEVEHLKLDHCQAWAHDVRHEERKNRREVEQLELKLEELETSQAERALARPRLTPAMSRCAGG